MKAIFFLFPTKGIYIYKFLTPPDLILTPVLMLRVSFLAAVLSIPSHKDLLDSVPPNLQTISLNDIGHIPSASSIKIQVDSNAGKD